jgi:ATP-dependent Lhr-like helicase
MDEASRCLIVPGNRFEYLEALAACDAVAAGELDPDGFRPGALDVLAQHVVGCAAATPFHPDDLYDEVKSAAPYAGLTRATFDAVLGYAATGGYALKAYERYQRLVEGRDGRWRLRSAALARQWRMNSGTIVEAVAMNVVFGSGKSRHHGRRLGQVEEYFAGQLRVGDSFMFAGQVLEVTGFDGADIHVRIGRGSPRVPVYAGGRMPMTTRLAARVRGLMNARDRWPAMPPDVREWLAMQARVSVLPGLDDVLVETFARDGRWYMVTYGFAGHPAHQTLGMLITQRMERAGLKPLGFVASDYAMACWSLDPVDDPRPLFDPAVLEDELAEWLSASPFLRRAFREVAIIGGLIERAQPGVVKSGRAMSVSADLIYDVLRKHEPDHLLLTAAWTDARGKLTDIDRLAALLEQAHGRMTHRRLAHVSPLAVPSLLTIGRERVGTEADSALLAEAEALIAEAMAVD